MGQPPIPERVEAVSKLSNFEIKYSSPWKDADQKGEKILVTIESGEKFEFDYLVLATGWIADLQLRPELENLVDDIALWEDIYTPPVDRNYKKLRLFPYLGKGFQFTPKKGSDATYLEGLFNFTGGGLLSNGFCAGTGLTGMKYSIKLFMDEIVRQFFIEEKENHYKTLDHYNKEDFDLKTIGL